MEISYTKLLTDSLAFFLEDVVIDVEPPHVDEDGLPAGSDVAAVGPGEGFDDLAAAVDGKKSRPSHSDGAARRGFHSSDTSPLDQQTEEAGEGLDYLAHWIEQITSKMKIVVQNVKVRVGLGENHQGSGSCKAPDPSLELRCTSLKWCDETPESSALMAEAPDALRDVVGGNGSSDPRRTAGGTCSHKVSVHSCPKEFLTDSTRPPQGTFLGRLLYSGPVSLVRLSCTGGFSDPRQHFSTHDLAP